MRSNTPTGKLSVQDLLRVRYLVTNDWPGNTKYKVGDIIYGYTAGYGGGELIVNDKGSKVWLSPENYPSNFKLLAWHELRSVEQLPKYVKVNTERSRLFLGQMFEVRLWKTFPSGEFYCWLEEPGLSLPELFKYKIDNFLPATQTEYEQYLLSQSKK